MLKVNLEIKENIQVIHLYGELNIQTTGEFENTFSNIKIGDIIIDMSELKYISSAGLRSLVILFERQNESKSTISLVGLNKIVNEIIEISGFDALFKVYRAVDDALESLRTSDAQI